MRPVRAGRFRHRVSVDEPVVTQDRSGAEVESWVTRATVWASVEPLVGRESLTANQPLSEVDTRITLRVSPSIVGLNASWRLRYQGIIYNVVNASDTETAGREFQVLCKSGKNKG